VGAPQILLPIAQWQTPHCGAFKQLTQVRFLVGA